LGLLDNEITAWRAGKNALLSGNKEKAWQYFQQVFDSRPVKQVFEAGQLDALLKDGVQQFLADVLSLGDAGREQIIKRRNVIESSIENGESYSDYCWQAFNEALAEPDRDIQILDRLKGSDVSKLHASLAVLISIVNRLGALGDRQTVRPYLELFVHNLSELPVTGFIGYEKWWSVVQEGIRCMRAALLASCVETLPLIGDCLIELSPPERNLSTLLEIDELAAKNAEFSDFIKMKVERLPKTVQLEFWLAKYFADEDLEGSVGGPGPDDRGAPRDEYIPEAKALTPLLKQNMSQEQFISAMHSVFGSKCFSEDENELGQKIYCHKSASRIYTLMQPILTRLDEYKS
jgi:hypothetical protein